MKFKDPKTGAVFEDIKTALINAYKCNECKGWADCAFGCEMIRDRSCYEYAVMNPAEAARLMGYEVVEDETCAACANEYPSIECVNCGSEHWNYCGTRQKLRICEVLGVEQGEDFAVRGYPNKDYPHVMVDLNGKVRKYIPDEMRPAGKISGNVLYWMIEHPESIVRTKEVKNMSNATQHDSNAEKALKDWTLGEVKEYCKAPDSDCHKCPFNDCLCDYEKSKTKAPSSWSLDRFTEEEVADARAIMDMFGCAFDAIRRSENGLFVYHSEQPFAEAVRLNKNFPSIPPGTHVKLSEIAGGNMHE